MSTIATGGKVWKIPSSDAAPIPTPPKKINRKRIFGFSIGMGLIAPLITIVFGLSPLKMETTGHESILGGYVEKYDFNFNALFFIPAVIALIATYVVARYGRVQDVITDPMRASYYGTGIMMLPFMIVIIASSLPAFGMLNPSVDKWAQEKYGYESVGSFSTGEIFTTATKPDGTEVRVGILHSHNNYYLYENVGQMDKIVAELDALETAK